LQCDFTKANGQPCRARALPGKTVCIFHDPAHARQRAAGRRAGGRASVRKIAVLPPEAPDLELRTVADVVVLLASTINQTRKGQLNPGVANTVGYLAATLLKALQEGDLEKRLAALEQAAHK
jgi:hypothetical protein